MFENNICALDIGSSKIAACLAQIKNKQIVNLYFESLRSKGVKKGSIVDSIELVETVGKVLRNLKAKSSINFKSVYTNISGQDIITKHTQAIIPLTERGNKVITTLDVERVKKQARILGSDLDEEVIHELPFDFEVDSKNGIINPIGLYGHKLAADLYLISARLSYVQTLTHVINQAGYEVKELLFSGFATSEIVFTDVLKSGTTVICDIGADITEVLLFTNGLLHNIWILHFGGDELTMGVRDSLDMPWELAEDIKIAYGIAGEHNIADDKEVLIKNDNTYRPIRQKLICEIITQKADQICSELKKVLQAHIKMTDINRFVVTGRTLLQEGFLELMEKNLGVAVEFGKITDPQILKFINLNESLSGRKYLTYLTALGLLCKEMNCYQPKAVPFNQPAINPVLRIFNKAKEVYQEYF